MRGHLLPAGEVLQGPPAQGKFCLCPQSSVGTGGLHSQHPHRHPSKYPSQAVDYAFPARARTSAAGQTHPDYPNICVTVRSSVHHSAVSVLHRRLLRREASLPPPPPWALKPSLQCAIRALPIYCPLQGLRTAWPFPANPTLPWTLFSHLCI